MKGPIQIEIIAFGFPNTPILQYSSTPKQLTIFTGNVIELLTGRVVCPPRLVRTGVKVNGGAAFGTLVTFIELVREYLLLCSATVAFANKRFEIFERLISWAMLWGRAHDKSPLRSVNCRGQ